MLTYLFYETTTKPMKNTLIALTIILTSCHAGRYIIYNFADYKDGNKFPAREISAPESTFYFKHGSKVNLDKLAPEGKTFEDYIYGNKTLSFLVIKNDSIVYESYLDKFDSTSQFTSFSMGKSFVSALVGIAIEEGKIKDVNEPITKYIPELKGEEFKKITIEHCLNMQSGIKFYEGYFNPFSGVAKYYYGRKILKYVSKLKVEKEPGKGFDYKSLDTQLLGIIVERATGKKLANYLEEKIWIPLEMEYDASWNIDSKKGDTEKAFCCLNARTVDFAKFGRLFLNKGKWHGKQVVPEKWVEKSLAGSPNYRGYSYQWWLINDKDKSYMAQGILGQYIYVNPTKNIIIVRMGKNWADVYWPRFFGKVAASL